MNKLILKLLSFFLIIIINSGCNRDSNEIKSYYHDGNIKELYFIDDDSLKHGKYLHYNRKGIIIEEKEYEHGKLNGEFLERDNKGNILRKYHFNNGMKDGEFWEYFNDGRVEVHGFAKKDTVEYYYKYDKNGTLIDVNRTVKIKHNAHNIKLKDTLIVETSLCGPLKDSSEIIGNFIIEYPFGMVSQKVYSVNNKGNGLIKFQIKYPGTYKVTVLNGVVREIGNRSYGEVICFNVDISSESTMSSFFISENNHRIRISKFLVCDGIKDTVLFYNHEEKAYVSL